MRDAPPAFLRVFFLTVVILVVAVAALNYLLDPAGLFLADGSKERAMAQANALGSTVVVEGNLDERKFQKYRVELMQDDPGTLVLGSSRVMQIGAALGFQSVMNLGVPGASLEDLVALHEAAAARFSPRNVIIGIDPWIFNDASGQNRWRSLEFDYKEALSRLASFGVAPSKLSERKGMFAELPQLLNASYTMASLQKLYGYVLGGGKPNIRIAQGTLPLEANDLLLADGSRVFSLTFRSMATNQIDLDASKWADYSIAAYEYSQRRHELLGALLRQVSTTSRPILYLAPYHPNTYALMLQSRPQVARTEKLVRALALSLDVEVIGSYDPVLTGCGSADFFDGAHPSDYCVKKSVGRIFQVPPSSRRN